MFISLQYARNVSQTCWMIEDERKGEASVEVLHDFLLLASISPYDFGLSIPDPVMWSLVNYYSKYVPFTFYPSCCRKS